MDIPTPGANLWDIHFLEPPKKQKKKTFYTVKWRFLAYFLFPRNGYLFWGKLWDMHFLEPPNIPKNAILQCKIEIFFIFSISQQWIFLLLGQTCGICIFWSHQKSKKSPFYSVKWRCFAYFPLPRNGYPYPWGKLVGYSFSAATKKSKKKLFYTVKWRFLAYFLFPRNGYLFWGKLWDMHFLEPPNIQKNAILQCKMEIFCIFSISQQWIFLLLGQTCGICIFWSHQKSKKISILQCKMEIFCIFSITQEWISLPLGQTCGIFIFWSHQKSKKSPFYTVKWRFFAYFPFSRNGNQHRNSKNQWFSRKYAKKIILQCKMHIFWKLRLWGKCRLKMEIFW